MLPVVFAVAMLTNVFGARDVVVAAGTGVALWLSSTLGSYFSEVILGSLTD